MRSHSRLTALTFGLVIGLVSACTDDSAAPAIADLAYSPETLVVGQQATISGTLQFDDPDGDLDQLGAEVTLPDGSQQALPMTDIRQIGSMTDGTLSWAMIIAPPMAGTYHLELWITDLDGNASNRLAGTVAAQ